MRYSRLKPGELPLTECLKDTVDRFLPYWKDVIAPRVKAGEKVVIVAHGNSLRALVMVLERLDTQAILDRELATGVPLIYHLNADSTVASKLDLAA